MAPSDYARSRDIVSKPAGDESSPLATTTTLVDGRPYLPNLVVDTSDEASVVASALSIVLLSIRVAASNGATDVGRGGTRAAAAVAGAGAADSLLLNDYPIGATSRRFSDMSSRLSCVKVTGGITNALFRVTGFGTIGPSIATALAPLVSSRDAVESLVDFDSVLVRIFGAEGMIDRDLETSTYSALCDAGIAYRYLGRFGNGRVEGWLDGYSPLACSDLADVDASLAIAREMARLHYTFVLPGGELEDRHRGVGLWDQLGGWMDQARGYAEFKTPEDTERVRGLGLDEIEVEVRNFIDSFAASSPPSNDEGNGGDGGKGGDESDKGKERIVFRWVSAAEDAFDFDFGKNRIFPPSLFRLDAVSPPARLLRSRSSYVATTICSPRTSCDIKIAAKSN